MLLAVMSWRPAAVDEEAEAVQVCLLHSPLRILLMARKQERVQVHRLLLVHASPCTCQVELLEY